MPKQLCGGVCHFLAIHILHKLVQMKQIVMVTLAGILAYYSISIILREGVNKENTFFSGHVNWVNHLSTRVFSSSNFNRSL